MSEDCSNANRVAKLVEQAAGAVAITEKKLGYRQAMKVVGFTADEIDNATLYKRVIRRSNALILNPVVGTDSTPVATVVVAPHQSTISSLTNGSVDSPPNDMAGIAMAGTPQLDASVTTPLQDKKHRRTVKELQRFNAQTNAQNSRQKQAMKVATSRIKRSLELPVGDPEKKSIKVIVNEVNTVYRSNVNPQTAARYVRKGLAGMSPLKPGPHGDFPKVIYEALLGAYCTYLKLEQAGGRKQSTIKHLVKLVNATVNAGGFTKTDDNLTRKLRRDTAGEFEVGKANIVEQRRTKWTTSYHLDMWYTSFKMTLIELGFARVKEPTDTITVGELYFYPGQLQRIVNFDETDGSIDDTTGKRGGRPPVTFSSPDISGGATAVNKSGYSATIIFGSSAAGEPLPPHFQLKSTAKTAETQRMSSAWFQHTHSILVTYGFETLQERPCTFGMNEKAGMNSIELQKYIDNAILPLFPDMEDVPGKRILLKVDSGPGRNNIDMLANLRLQGCYLVPGVPNTTAVTQETDQNYGPFKLAYRKNIGTLSQARFQVDKGMMITDLPLLVFGGTCTKTGAILTNAFQNAFSHDSNLAVWAKCGAVPLTRLAIKSNKVRHEVPVMAALEHQEGLTITVESPEIQKLQELDDLNLFYCNILNCSGFAGSKLRMEAPKRRLIVAISKPNSMERQLAMKKATSAGATFQATGGGHLNSNDFFKAAELKARESKLKALEEVKKDRDKYCKDQWAAIRLIRAKGELTLDTEKLFTMPEIKTMLKWKKIRPSGTKKRELVQAYTEAPKPPIQPIWKRSEQQAMDALREDENVPLQSTALGAAANRMVRNLKNSMGYIDADALKELEAIIQARKELDNPNAL
jgi:hypothetical protein